MQLKAWTAQASSHAWQGTGYQSMLHRPSPFRARSMLPVRHSGHSLSTAPYCQSVVMRSLCTPEPGPAARMQLSPMSSRSWCQPGRGNTGNRDSVGSFKSCTCRTVPHAKPTGATVREERLIQSNEGCQRAAVVDAPRIVVRACKVGPIGTGAIEICARLLAVECSLRQHTPAGEHALRGVVRAAMYFVGVRTSPV